MAQSDPQGFTPTGGTALSLGRIQTGSGTLPSVYQTADRLWRLEMNSRSIPNGNRLQFTWAVTQKKLAADIFVPTTNVERSASLRVTFNFPSVGFSETELVAISGAFTNWATTGSGANLAKGLRLEI